MRLNDLLRCYGAKEDVMVSQGGTLRRASICYFDGARHVGVWFTDNLTDAVILVPNRSIVHTWTEHQRGLQEQLARNDKTPETTFDDFYTDIQRAVHRALARIHKVWHKE